MIDCGTEKIDASLHLTLARKREPYIAVRLFLEYHYYFQQRMLPEAIMKKALAMACLLLITGITGCDEYSHNRDREPRREDRRNRDDRRDSDGQRDHNRDRSPDAYH